MITLLIIEINTPIENKAAHKNNMISRFCIASLKSQLKFEDKTKLNEVIHFTCECFLTKINSGSSIKESRMYCRDKTEKEFNLIKNKS